MAPCWRGEAPGPAVRADVPVGADAGRVPGGENVPVVFVAQKKIVHPSRAGGENSVGAQIVAMSYVEKQPALRSKQSGDAGECSPSFFRGWNVPQHVPQAGDDVELFDAGVGTHALIRPRGTCPVVFSSIPGQAFGPHRPDLGLFGASGPPFLPP